MSSTLKAIAKHIDQQLVQDQTTALLAEGWVMAPRAEVINKVFMEAWSRSGVGSLGAHERMALEQLAENAVDEAMRAERQQQLEEQAIRDLDNAIANLAASNSMELSTFAYAFLLARGFSDEAATHASDAYA